MITSTSRVLGALTAFMAVSGTGAPPARGGAAERPFSGRVVMEISVHPDGSSTERTHLEYPADSPAVRQSTVSLSYIAAFQKVRISSAYTRAPDGSRTLVDPSRIGNKSSAPAPVSLTDSTIRIGGMRQIQVAFSPAHRADTLVVDVTTESDAQIPRQYYFGAVYPFWRGAPLVHVEISAPESMPLQVEAHGVRVSRRSGLGGPVYVSDYPDGDLPTSADASRMHVALSRTEWWPRIYVTSAKDYGELAEGYSRLVRPKIASSPSIRSLAQSIVAKLSSRRDKAEAIYRWMSVNIRYAAVDLGETYIVPHSADEVLAARAGDCKDEGVLFAALLKAVDIDASLALINPRADSPSIPSVPSLSAFPHVITWIPDLQVYADTTVGNLPFGVLPFGEYGKSVVLVAGRDVGPSHTPALLPEQSTVKSDTSIEITKSAGIVGHGQTTATGPASIWLRSIGDDIRASGAKTAARHFLSGSGLPQVTGEFRVVTPTHLSRQVTIETNYSAGPLEPVQREQPFPMPEGARLMMPYSPALVGEIGDETYAGASSIPCHSAIYTDTVRLVVPPGMRVVETPSDVHLSTSAISYDSHWSVEGRNLAVRREFKARFEASICSGRVLADAEAAFARIRRDFSAKIRIGGTSKSRGP